MSTTVRLEEVSPQVAANANGEAIVRLGPVPPYQRWTVTRLSVSSQSVDRSAATVYRGEPFQGNILDSAPYSGNSDTTDTVFTFETGETITVQWTGATVGALCNATLSGERTTL